MITETYQAKHILLNFIYTQDIAKIYKIDYLPNPIALSE